MATTSLFSSSGNGSDLSAMAVCAAVIGAQNNPLYLQTFLTGTEEEQLRFHFTVHCALDAIEEKVAAPKRAPNEINDPYLGMLYPTEDYKVYGYISSTKVKLVLITDKTEFKDSDVKQAFHQIYVAYVNAASNPFYTPGQPITSPKFDSALKLVIKGVQGV